MRLRSSVMLDAVHSRDDAESARANLEEMLGAPLLAIDPTATALGTGASVGLAMYPDDGSDVESPVQQATPTCTVASRPRAAAVELPARRRPDRSRTGEQRQGSAGRVRRARNLVRNVAARSVPSPTGLSNHSPAMPQ